MKLFIFAVLVSVPLYSLALMPENGTEFYDYEDMFFLGKFRVENKGYLACIYSKDRGSFSVKIGERIGRRGGVLRKINKNYIVLEDVFLVNGGDDFVMTHFKWPKISLKEVGVEVCS